MLSCARVYEAREMGSTLPELGLFELLSPPHRNPRGKSILTALTDVVPTRFGPGPTWPGGRRERSVGPRWDRRPHLSPSRAPSIQATMCGGSEGKGHDRKGPVHVRSRSSAVLACRVRSLAWRSARFARSNLCPASLSTEAARSSLVLRSRIWRSRLRIS